MRETTVTTGVVRLSYANLLEPKADNFGGDPKYSTVLLIPKSDVITKQNLDDALNAAIQQGLVENWKGVKPPDQFIYGVIKDGDGLKQNGEPYGDECKGHWVINASTKNRPGILGPDKLEMKFPTSDEVYSGMYAYASINFYPYNAPARKGVAAGLNHIMKARDGERLGGGAPDINVAFADVQPATQNAFSQSIDPISGLPL